MVGEFRGGGEWEVDVGVDVLVEQEVDMEVEQVKRIFT
jgi:hypothetical protein